MLAVQEQRWVDLLDEEDLSFIKRFVLFSGSLKELAQSYGVTYPTVRLRLDRVIQKIQILDDQRVEDTYERLLRAEYADGKLDLPTFKKLLNHYRGNKEKP
jgi:hypothetical protein